jgi:excisionase family DNA binding protein
VRLLTAQDLAERWQVPVSQVYNLARAGTIPVVRIGRYVRFRLEAIERWERGE